MAATHVQTHGSAPTDADHILGRVNGWLKKNLAHLRQITGDDAYERYLAHHHLHHAGEAVLDRRAFYLAEQQRKWTGVKRCC